MSSAHKRGISIHTVKAVLNIMMYSSQHEEALQEFAGLAIIKERLQDHRYVMIERHALLEYAVQELLTQTIQHELKKKRNTFNIPHRRPQLLETRDQALADICLDAHSQAPNLIGWSLLYHLYVRPDLNISHGDFAALAHVDERTLRRYKNQATQELLKCIIHWEIELQTRLPESNVAIASG